MLRKMKFALAERVQRSHRAWIERLSTELDGVYDLVFHVFGEEELSISILQKILRAARNRGRNEIYQKYLRLWIFRITAEVISATYGKFLHEHPSLDGVPFGFLSLEEKLVLFLHEREGMNYRDISSVLQVPESRVGRCVTYGREKIIRVLWPDQDALTSELTLLDRVQMNCQMDGESSTGEPKAVQEYIQRLAKVRAHLTSLPEKAFWEIEGSIRVEKLLPLLRNRQFSRWKSLPWQYKMGAEAAALAFVGIFAVIVLPWTLSNINTDALWGGRYSEIFVSKNDAFDGAPKLPEISTDRLLASSTEKTEDASIVAKDEFADMDFPPGDSYEMGSAPLAPSRQQAAVYRLIVQSPSPQDLIASVREILAKKNVKEREGSGKIMPRGVYFDGITDVGTYPKVLQEIQKLGETKAYSNPDKTRSSSEHARLIIWLQQI